MRTQPTGRSRSTASPTNRPRAVGLPLVTVQQLDYLVAISDAPTWAVAAKRLGVSPSALSQGIAELERRLGLQLFERIGRRRVLAVASSPVLDYARAVIAQTGDLGRWIQQHSTAGSGQLRVGLIDAAALHYFSDTLRQFRVDFPQIDLRLSVAPSGPLLDQVQRNRLDFAVIVRPSVRPPDLFFVPLVEDPMAVYGPGDTEAGPPSTWGPWVAFPQTSHTRTQIEQHLERLGAPYPVVAESNQPEVLCEMVRLGLGWTVLPMIQAESGTHPLKRMSPKELFSRQLISVRRSNALPHPNADELLRRLAPAPS